MKRFNWPVWAGFLLTVIAGVSFTTIFVWYPVTRDFPWANLLLFAIAMTFLAVGVRRAFAPGRRLGSKILAASLATLSVAMVGLFVFAAFFLARWLPGSEGAPRIGQSAPEFTLADSSGKQVSLAELLTMPINDGTSEAEAGTKPNSVLLVFYRGYW
ncbi:MAG TPA: hypothetical protein VMM84_00260 [Pyrinomonadaceae bacterium]|nr:hypothetical protein [Pyrinomonadaceae bacterium]